MWCFSDMFNPLKSEDKTLRINRVEEAAMNNNFEENGLVKKKWIESISGQQNQLLNYEPA